jgi:hypothetical protein
MADPYAWVSDELSLDDYRALTKKQDPLLGSTKNSQDPNARKLYQDARKDLKDTIAAVRNNINDLTEKAKKICGIAKCDPKDKSKCMNLVCDKQQWIDQLNKFAQAAETGMWRGMANDKEKIYTPITVNELVEVKILIRRNHDQWYAMIGDALNKLDKSAFQKFKRQFKNVKNIKAGDEHAIVTAITVVLVILFLLALWYLFNLVFKVENLTSTCESCDYGQHYSSFYP